jgi:hypothetical protein
MSIRTTCSISVALLTLPTVLIVVTPRVKGEEPLGREAGIAGGQFEWAQTRVKRRLALQITEAVGPRLTGGGSEPSPNAEGLDTQRCAIGWPCIRDMALDAAA